MPRGRRVRPCANAAVGLLAVLLSACLPCEGADAGALRADIVPAPSMASPASFRVPGNGVGASPSASAHLAPRSAVPADESDAAQESSSVATGAMHPTDRHAWLIGVLSLAAAAGAVLASINAGATAVAAGDACDVLVPMVGDLLHVGHLNVLDYAAGHGACTHRPTAPGSVPSHGRAYRACPSMPIYVAGRHVRKLMPALSPSATARRRDAQGACVPCCTRTSPLHCTSANP